MKVLGYYVGQEPFVWEFDGSLKTMQSFVEGNIEVTPYRQYCIVSNEDSFYLKLPANRMILPHGVIYGHFFICGFDGIDNLCSLTDADIEALRNDRMIKGVL